MDEWSDFDEELYGLLSPPPDPRNSTEWTREEMEMFENSLAETEIDPSSPTFFENVAAKIPWKTVEEIKIRYEALVNNARDDDEDGRVAPRSRRTRTGQPRRRGVPWTEEEHQLFLMGLNKYGKGDWRSISRYYVINKTPTQVASHAQKFFRRRSNCTPPDRRRPSIHDVQTVNPPATAVVTQARHFNGGGLSLYPPAINSGFSPAAAAAVHPVLNQSVANYGSGTSCFFSSNWGWSID